MLTLTLDVYLAESSVVSVPQRREETQAALQREQRRCSDLEADLLDARTRNLVIADLEREVTRQRALLDQVANGRRGSGAGGGLWSFLAGQPTAAVASPARDA